MIGTVLRWIRANPHCWWALVLFYLIAVYILPEKLVVSGYVSTAIPLDDKIPFFAPAVVFYVLWFPLLFFSGLWLLLKDGLDFRRYMFSLGVCMTLAAVIYLLWPNGQDLRPDLSQPCGLFEWMLGGLYRIDTNTNVLPSLHVACVVPVVACLRASPGIRRRWIPAAVGVLSLLVAASTVFVKQHAILDLAAGVVLGAFAVAVGFAVFRRRGKKAG